MDEFAFALQGLPVAPENCTLRRCGVGQISVWLSTAQSSRRARIRMQNYMLCLPCPSKLAQSFVPAVASRFPAITRKNA